MASSSDIHFPQSSSSSTSSSSLFNCDQHNLSNMSSYSNIIDRPWFVKENMEKKECEIYKKLKDEPCCYVPNIAQNEWTCNTAKSSKKISFEGVSLGNLTGLTRKRGRRPFLKTFLEKPEIKNAFVKDITCALHCLFQRGYLHIDLYNTLKNPPSPTPALRNILWNERKKAFYLTDFDKMVENNDEKYNYNMKDFYNFTIQLYNDILNLPDSKIL